MGLARNLSKFKPNSDGLVEANDIAPGAIPPSGFQGGTNVTSSSNVTLTSSSVQVQRIAMTADNLNVVLPDATTCTKGGVIFSILNSGNRTFGIVDASGFSYGTLDPSNALSLFLADNSTVAGTWTTVTRETRYLISPVTALPTNTTSHQIIALTDTTGVIIRSASVSSVGTIFGRTYSYNSSTGVFSFGSEQTLYTNSASSAASIRSVIVLENNSFLVTFIRYSSNFADAMCFAGTISGTTISVGSVQTIQAGSASIYADSHQVTQRLNNSTVFFMNTSYNVSNGQQVAIYRAATISGNSISMGGSSTWYSSTTGRSVNWAFSPDSSTVMFGYYSDVDSTFRGIGIVSVSGNSVTSFNAPTRTDVPNAQIEGYAYVVNSTTVRVIATNSANSSYSFTHNGTSVLSVTDLSSTLGGVPGTIIFGQGNQLMTQPWRFFLIGDTVINTINGGSTSGTPNGAGVGYGQNHVLTPSKLSVVHINRNNTSHIALVKGWL